MDRLSELIAEIDAIDDRLDDLGQETELTDEIKAEIVDLGRQYQALVAERDNILRRGRN